jgi:glutamate-ammonia-ligase adenylyltransferase
MDAPEDAIITLLRDAGSVAEGDLDTGLRQVKRRAALLVALADLGGVWSLQTVTQAWTDLADACLAAALQAHVAREARRGKIPGQTEEDARRDGAGMVALAMGKMGAGELNYSSDIDLICLFDETRFDPGDEMDARAGFIRATRRIAATLGETTARAMSFAPTAAAARCGGHAGLHLHGRGGALLRGRGAVLGTLGLYQGARRRRATSRRASGSWRRCNPSSGGGIWTSRWCRTPMDMRRRIREHKGLTGGAGIPLEGHNIKLGARRHPRDRVLRPDPPAVAGGRDPSLRDRAHGQGAGGAGRADWITARTGQRPGGALRPSPGGRASPADDRRRADPHLPKSDEGFDRLARFCGEGDTERLRARLEEKLRRSRPSPEPSSRRWRPRRPRPRSGPRPRRSWRAGRATRRCGPRGQEIFERLKPGFPRLLRQGGEASGGACRISTGSCADCLRACSFSRCSRRTRSLST